MFKQLCDYFNLLNLLHKFFSSYLKFRQQGFKPLQLMRETNPPSDRWSDPSQILALAVFGISACDPILFFPKLSLFKDLSTVYSVIFIVCKLYTKHLFKITVISVNM